MTNEQNLLCLVTAEELRPSRKSPFWQINIRTLSGDTKIVIWDIQNESVPGLPRKGDLILVDLGHKDVRDQRTSEYANLKAVLDAIKFIQPEQLTPEQKDKLYLIESATKEQLDKAYKTIADKNIYKDVNNFAFVMACLAAVDRETLFKCAAGKTIHHRYQGGLIVHTAEVIEICRGVVDHFPYKHLINQDVVYAGASLHDIGKCMTYSSDKIGQPIHKVEETLMGHLFYGAAHVQKVGQERKVDEQFLMEVVHIIASHHSRPEFGAIKSPASLEAIIISQADYLSSRAGMLDAKLTPMKKNHTKLEEEWRFHEDHFVFGSAIKDWMKL